MLQRVVRLAFDILLINRLWGLCVFISCARNSACIHCILAGCCALQALGAYGHFPDCFRNNTSKRSRSSYLTDSKTHSLSNAEFDEIVSGPCHYCGKASNPPFHYNGLDRLDSTNRVYNTKTCVSCCGTCNVCKWRYTE